MRKLAIASLCALFAAACSCGKPPPAPSKVDAGSGSRNDSGVINQTDGGPGSLCINAGDPCGAASSSVCCTGTCSPDAGVCETSSTPVCKGPGSACTAPTECCTNDCFNGACSSQTCHANGQACTAGNECCSTLCSGGTCQAVPGATCGTIGQACSTGADCCSTLCSGGICAKAAACQANGDMCTSNADCCGACCGAAGSQTCGLPSGTTVGVCLFITGGGAGGCVQDGNPCASGTDCCTRVCADVYGTGATVCGVASGCRMTGDYCDSSQSCCGGGTNPNGTVTCNSGRCDNGQSCNAVGNICGHTADGGVNASQNCCDGHMTPGGINSVCKPDQAGIYRCYGGYTGNCPTGWDPNDPSCCIGSGSNCQFSGQCCGGIPCVPNDAGVLTCQTQSCLAVGAPCQGDGGAQCCSGTECLQTLDTGTYACQVPPAPTDGGAADAGGCLANGTSCTSAAQCCSAICNGTCQAPSSCQPQGAACTTSGDCCTGLTCTVPAGSTSGTCQTGATCNGAGQACSPASGCCVGLICTDSATGGTCSGTNPCVCKIFG